MEHVEVELYAHEPNFAVIRLPPRRFPGVLVQGDSLSVLCNQARAVLAALHTGHFEQARDEARSLAQDLDDQLQGYMATLEREGIGLPFSRPVAQQPPDT